MPLFFLIAGYFVSQSYDKQGICSFLKKRLLRLGLPFIIFVLGIMPLFMYTLCYFNNLDLDLLSSWRCVLNTFQVHHLWFLAQLLLFSIGYALWWLNSASFRSETPLQSWGLFWSYPCFYLYSGSDFHLHSGIFLELWSWLDFFLPYAFS